MLLLLAAITACGQQADTAASADQVRAGVDVLIAGDVSALSGRVGLITNHTGRTRDGRSTIDALAEHPDIALVALFAPEHGIRGTAEAGERIASDIDPSTGLPIHSLYAETRAPTPAMLEDIDVLAFDIQDIGTRYYTYVWTMALAMQAAADHGKRFVVLDRPNPIGGVHIQGNVLDTTFASFVGLYPVPMRHGMTAGELARFLAGEFRIGVDLDVIPAAGWRRNLWFDETGLEWRAPSPNMPNLESATHYPGTCLFEGTNLSVARGTPIAFQQVGAPWLDADSVVRRVTARGLPGVRFEEVTFTPVSPGDGKYADQPVNGVRFFTTDRSQYDPVHAALAVLIEVHAVHPDRFEFRAGHFDRLAGTDQLRIAILEGQDLDELTVGWEDRLEIFRHQREPYLIYP